MAINGTVVADPAMGAATKDRRRRRRKPVIWSARLEIESGIIDCTAFDVSEGGARLRLDGAAVALNRPVRLVLDRFGVFDAETVWRRGTILGLRFTEPSETVRDRLASAIPI